MAKKKKLIIYDLDGTLADTARDIVASANHMRLVFGLGPLSHERVSGYVGQGLHYLVKNCLETEDSKTVEKASKIYREYYGAHMLDHSRLFPGAAEFLAHFKERSQAVLTNKPDPFSKDLLHALGVGGFFFEIIPGNSQFAKKPSPESIFWLMKKVDALHDEVLMVGDSSIDIETARSAGVMAVCLTHGFSHANELKSLNPDVMTDSFQDLLRIAIEKGW